MLNNRDDTKAELAAAAARLIAEDGLDYATAKQKAARAVLGDGARARGALPDNAQIELELRRYLATFQSQHSATLAALRQLALQLMRRLQAFEPHLVGAVLNGTATEHSNLHLQLFADSAKEVEFFLLEQGVEFEVAEGGDQPGAPVEVLHLVVQPARTRAMPPRVGVVIDVYTTDAIRIAPKHRSSAPDLHPVEAAGRASLDMVDRLIADRSAES
jgi:hypothetical protein